MGFSNVGKVWTPATLETYLSARSVPSWVKSITLHHTAAPSLAQRPSGFTLQHIKNIQDCYQRPKSQGGAGGWSSGPHLFVDEDEIFGMCDFKERGIHAVSFNSTSLGIEVLGDYDQEDPTKGRGLRCWQTAAAATRVLLDWLGLKKSATTILFHRDDPQTSKSCPGEKVKKDWFLSLIPTAVADPVHAQDAFEKPDVGMPWTHWHFEGERWSVPVLDFLMAKGVPSAEITAKLRVVKGVLTYDGELLAGGFYVPKGGNPKPDERTWAPARDLMEILG